MNNQRFCKRCLTLESGERGIYENIQSYIARLPEPDRAGETEYRRRLEACRGCEWLLSGMCRQCGCYVELRAAVAGRSCPEVPPRWDRIEA